MNHLKEHDFRDRLHGQSHHRAAPVRYRARRAVVALTFLAAVLPTVPAAQATAQGASPSAATAPTQPTDRPPARPGGLSGPELWRAGLPPFLASLGSGTVLAVTGWGIKRIASRRAAP
ncbi:hypothetical protein SNS2_4376 [Streptomyces netropsis]|uniref:Uncharacterized protein n=1 Tax=Streptomyces syringium TaxID=76729 RepID=A0ABS4YE59_9ACTN|nr:hypothetical protein [Streptomyces syringium]MBP2406935.1 hypothetical protein [Streptomyces syringium]SPE62054.1 hypothetical protein SNS2_4376 [Streptomyces netropsis]